MTLDFQQILQIFLILAYLWPNHWYLEERKGFVHVLLVPINDNNWVRVNSRSKHWVNWLKMSENCFLKGKNGQFYSIKWLKYGFSPNRLAELFQYYDFSTKIYLYFDLYVAECQIQFLWLLSRFHRYVSWLLLDLVLNCVAALAKAPDHHRS